MSSSPRSYKTVSEYRESRDLEAGHPDDVAAEAASGAVCGSVSPLPGSIEAALACFDVEAASSTSNNPRSTGAIAQFMSREIKSELSTAQQAMTVPRMAAVPPRPSRNIPVQTKGPVERDESGRVTCVRFSGGDVANFRYDASGALSVFTYGGLNWVREEAGFWRSGDRQVDYRIDGDVAVLHDGSIRVTKADVTRTLKITGVRIDEHRDGSRTESRKMRNAPTPFDLLAKSKPVSSVWLSSTRPSGEPEKIESIQLFQTNDEMEHSPLIDGLISSSRNRMFTSETLVPASTLRNMETNKSVKGAPFVQEPQSGQKMLPAETAMLRNAVSRLPQAQEVSPPGSLWQSFKRDTAEYVLKGIVWAYDIVRGPACPGQIRFLDRLALLYAEKQENDNAETAHLRSLQIKESYYGSRQPELAVNVSGLAEIYRRRHNFTRAEQMYKEAMRLHEKSVRKHLFLFSQGVFEERKLTSEIDGLFRCIAGLADTYDAQKKHTATRDLYERAMSLWTEISNKANHRLDTALDIIIDRYVSTIKTTSHREPQTRPTKMIPTAS